MEPTACTGHAHSLSNIVGYRVRQTMRDGQPLVGKELVVLAAIDRPGGYLEALQIAQEHRTTLYRTGDKGRRVFSESPRHREAIRDLYRRVADPYVASVDYACVDNVYGCGCTFGDTDYPPEVLAAAPRQGYWYLPTAKAAS